MTLRCKPGDLAIVIRSTMDVNVGRTARVLRFFGGATFRSGLERDDCWLVEGDFAFPSGKPFCSFARKLGADACVPDAWLRPIRHPGDDATDEMLLLVGSPNWQEA